MMSLSALGEIVKQLLPPSIGPIRARVMGAHIRRVTVDEDKLPTTLIELRVAVRADDLPPEQRHELRRLINNKNLALLSLDPLKVGGRE